MLVHVHAAGARALVDEPEDGLRRRVTLVVCVGLVPLCVLVVNVVDLALVELGGEVCLASSVCGDVESVSFEFEKGGGGGRP